MKFLTIILRGLVGGCLLFLTFLVYIMSRADSLLWKGRCKRIGMRISPSWSISRLFESYRFFCTYGLRQFCVHNAAQGQRERKTRFTRRGFIIYGSLAGIGVL